MKCLKCNNEIPENSKFCMNCGEKIVKCPACGYGSLPSIAKYCPKCGKSLSVEENITKSFNVGTEHGNSNVSKSHGVSSAINKFFPVFGFTLGKVSVADVKSKGYNVERINSESHCCQIKDFAFWDHDGDNIFEQIYIVCLRCSPDNILPEKWVKELGINWRSSYNQLILSFKNLGFGVIEKITPHTVRYSGRKTLSAKVTATSADGHLIFDLVFDYGNDHGEGYSTDSSNSLYSMTVKVK